MADIGSAYLTIFPSMSGFGKELTGYLNGVDLSGAGQRMGSSLSKSISAQVSDVGLKGLEDAVVKAEMKVRSAMDKSADAAKELEIAQKRLSEARAKYPADSSQVAQAELRVQQAQRKSAAAAKEVDNAQGQLAHAQRELETATESSTSALRAQDGAMDSLGGSSHGLSGKLSAITGAAMGVAAELAGRLFDAVLDLGSEMVEASDSAQKFASTLSFAGIDDSTIKQLTASTQEYADQTVYDLADIRNVTAQLAANGVDNYEQLAQAAGNLNAVAGGSANTFQSVAQVMTQTAGAGKLTTENWNQLTDAIPGASGALQQAMRDAGAFEGNFREAMENGEISADEFFAAVQKLGMQDVAVEAATSTSTIEGALGNLQASVVGVGSQVITELNPVITGAMNLLTDAISSIPSAAAEVAPKLGEFFAPILETAQGVSDQLQPLFSGLFGAMFDQMQAGLPLITPLASMLQTIGSTVVSIGGQLMSVLLPILTQIITFITEQVIPIVAPALQSIFETVQTAMPLIQYAIESALTAIQIAWNAVWPVLQAVLVPIMSGISATVQVAMTIIQGIIEAVLAIINGDWDGAWEAISSTCSEVWSIIGDTISGALDAVGGFISDALSGIQSAWDSAWSSVKSFLSDTWEGIKTGVQSGIDSVVGYLEGLPGQITGIFAGAGSWLVESGSALLQGFADGVMGAVGWVGDQISGALSQIRSLFPFSPAKRGPFSGHGYTTYSGRALMTDFGESIARSGASAVSAAMGVMSDVSTALRSDGSAQLGVGAYGYGAPAAPAGGGAKVTNVYLDGRLLDVEGRVAQKLEEFVDAVDAAWNMGKAVRA